MFSKLTHLKLLQVVSCELWGLMSQCDTWALRNVIVEDFGLIQTTWGSLACTSNNQHMGIFAFCRIEMQLTRLGLMLLPIWSQ